MDHYFSRICGTLYSMQTDKSKLIHVIKEKAEKAGPVRTFLIALHLVNHNDNPLSNFTKNIELIEDELWNHFSQEEFNLFLAAAGAAFRYFREFPAAVHFFKRASYMDEFNELALLSYEFGDIEGLRKIDSYLKEDSEKQWLPDKKAVKEFLIKKVVPSLGVSGDQYHGFRFNSSEIEALRKEVAGLDFKSITGQCVRWLLSQGCKDIARLYILSIHSEDSELIGQVGSNFTRQATLPRRRTLSIIEDAYPESTVELIKKGDTFSVRPKHRFVIKITHSDGSACILKEILPPVSTNPVERDLLLEHEILSSISIDGVPQCTSIVELEKMSFIQICHLNGDSLESLLAKKKLPSKSQCISIFESLARILYQLHEHHIAHLDICEKNVLFDGQNTYLLGFDNAIKTNGKNEDWFIPSPSQNITPEGASRFKGSCKSDCFQLGLMMHRLLTGRHAFGWPEVSLEPEKLTNMKQIDYIVPMLFLEPNIDPSLAEHEISTIIERLLYKDPSARMSAREAWEQLKTIQEPMD